MFCFLPPLLFALTVIKSTLREMKIKAEIKTLCMCASLLSVSVPEIFFIPTLYKSLPLFSECIAVSLFLYESTCLSAPYK